MTIYTDPTLYERQALPEVFWTETLDAIVRKYGVKTAYDFGCGLGVDVVMMQQAGLSVIGFEGSLPMVEHVLFEPLWFQVADLTADLELAGADLVWCREVAEHIPFEHAQTLVRNIARHCRVCYFTAAPPGQIGCGHINAQYPGFWEALFRKHGFYLAHDLTALNRRHPNPDDRRNGRVYVNGP